MRLGATGKPPDGDQGITVLFIQTSTCQPVGDAFGVNAFSLLNAIYRIKQERYNRTDRSPELDCKSAQQDLH